MISNFHSHCTFCDGRSYPEDFVKSAVSKKMRAYGFSSHSPLPFETFWNMSKGDMPEYIEEISRLKQKYIDNIEIYTGLEIDYLDETYNASVPFFRDLPLDYRIGSIHFLKWQSPLSEQNMVTIDGFYEHFEEGVKLHFGGSIRKAVEAFFETSMNMIKAGGIDIVGHIDKIYMNGSKHKDFDIRAEWYRKPFMKLLDFVAEKGLIVEINTKNLVGKGQTYPHRNSFKELKERNIPIMINADTHYPDLVCDGYKIAVRMLKEAGYESTRELVGGKWKDVYFEL